VRRLQELLDQAQAAGLVVVAAESCPSWLASLAKSATEWSNSGPVLWLLGNQGLDQANLSAESWTLVALEEGKTQLAPTLVATELATHRLQVIEVFTVPAPHLTGEGHKLEYLALARVVDKTLALSELDPWAPAPPPLTLIEQLATVNQESARTMAHQFQLRELTMERDAAEASAAALLRQLDQSANQIDCLEASAEKQRQELARQAQAFATMDKRYRDQVKMLRDQNRQQVALIKALKGHVQALKDMPPWQFLRPRIGAAVRRLPGGGLLIKVLKRLQHLTK